MLNHLTAGRVSRGAYTRSGRLTPRLPVLGQILDCYFDYARADSSVQVTICEVMAEPWIVSNIETGYIEHDPGSTAQVLAMLG